MAIEILENGEELGEIRSEINANFKAFFPSKEWGDFTAPLIIGHRGAYDICPENTITAFDYCLNAGVKAIELDIIMTVDNVFFVSHNDDLTTLTDIQLTPACYISTSYSDQIAKANPCNLWNYMARSGGSTDNPIYYYQSLPKFIDVLYKYGGKILLMVEFKQNSRTIGQKAAQIVKDLNLQDFVLFHSFYADPLRGVKDIDTTIKTAVLSNTAQTVSQIQAYNVDWVNFLYSVVTQQIVTDFHTAGMKVFAYTASLTRDVETLNSYGIDGIVCEDPVFAMEMLTNPYWTAGNTYYNPTVSVYAKSGLRFIGYDSKLPSFASVTRPYIGSAVSNASGPTLAISPGIRTHRSVRYTFNVKIFEQASDANRAFGILCLCAKEDAIAGWAPPQISNRYQLFYRQNGNIKWVKDTDAGGTTLGSEINISTYATGSIIQCQVDITATTLKFTRLDTSESLEVTDSSYTEGWLIPFEAGVGACFGDITVTSL
jgi:glycerophosphoryl diester phosphodiesterase